MFDSLGIELFLQQRQQFLPHARPLPRSIAICLVLAPTLFLSSQVLFAIRPAALLAMDE